MTVPAPASRRVLRTKYVSVERAARLNARARRVALTPAAGPARPAAPPTRHVLTAAAVQTPALARATTTAAQGSVLPGSAEAVYRAVAPVPRILSVARATAPARPPGIAVIPATLMSMGLAVQMLTSAVRSVVHLASFAAMVAVAPSVAPPTTVDRTTSAQVAFASLGAAAAEEAAIVSLPARRL